MDKKQIEKTQKIRAKGARILAILMIIIMVLFTVIGAMMFMLD